MWIYVYLHQAGDNLIDFSLLTSLTNTCCLNLLGLTLMVMGVKTCVRHTTYTYHLAWCQAVSSVTWCNAEMVYHQKVAIYSLETAPLKFSLLIQNGLLEIENVK